MGPWPICRDFPECSVTERKFLGFYWTLPVPWAGFNALPKDVDEAARASTTIRYQRERVRRWVKQEGGEIIAEETFLELAPDRGSEQLVSVVEKLLKRCEREDAKLVLVDFSEAFGWRRHGALWDRLDGEDVCEPLDPSPILMDGTEFDPVQHFRTWREIEYAHVSGKTDRKAELAETIKDLATDHETNASMAQALNAAGLFTPNGKRWTADNLRKFMKTL